MKVNFIYSQGSARIPEDGIVFQPPNFYGVIDGISGIYLPYEEPRLFDGRTGGQLVSHVISRAFGSSLAEDSLEEIIRRANTLIYKLSNANGLSIIESEFLPSAAFVTAKIAEKSIDILQGGDSLAVWLMKDGTTGATSNKTFDYEKGLLDTIALLMEKHKHDRQKMWEEFRPILIGKRRTSINTTQGGFALINGQEEVENFWQKVILQREEVMLLILFSDGFVPFEWTRDEESLAKKVVHLYQGGGMYAVLEETRQIAKRKKFSSHEDYAEATAVAIEF